MSGSTPQSTDFSDLLFKLNLEQLITTPSYPHCRQLHLIWYSYMLTNTTIINELATSPSHHITQFLVDCSLITTVTYKLYSFSWTTSDCMFHKIPSVTLFVTIPKPTGMGLITRLHWLPKHCLEEEGFDEYLRLNVVIGLVGVKSRGKSLGKMLSFDRGC